MDTPPIQYARTADGVHIAYWTLGGGPPLLVLPGLGSSHLELELSQPLHRAQHETLAGQMQVLRYDVRNCGLSDRNVEAAGFDEQYRDMVAVIDAAGADRVAFRG
jgi:pimeloyl-ACP methyl ester carboxylesterase